jgi:hypothetical protein
VNDDAIYCHVSAWLAGANPITPRTPSAATSSLDGDLFHLRDEDGRIIEVLRVLPARGMLAFSPMGLMKRRCLGGAW